MTKKIPFGFMAKMADGRLISQGDQPIMFSIDATDHEIEQTILERIQEYGDVLNVVWHKLSDYNL